MVITVLASFGQAVTTSWQQMLAARVVLGLGVGISSSTVPVYSSECAPTAIRGALTMQWQVFTAMGIMLGNAVSLMFYQVPDQPGIQGFRWRLMMAAPAVPSLFVCIFVFWCPESPRWLMSDLLGPPNWWPTILTPKRGVAAAYRSMRCLRKTRLQAARDCYLAFKQIEAQEAVERAQGYRSLWKVKRNRRALYASQTVMIFQQVSLVPCIPEIISSICCSAGFDASPAILTLRHHALQAATTLSHYPPSIC